MKETKKECRGVIGFYLEEEAESIGEWIFVEDGKIGWARVNVLGDGDYLIIYKEDNSVAFEGEIKPDYKIGRKTIPGAKCEPIIVLGKAAVSWIQKDCQPDDWAALFFSKPPLRAILIKK